MRDLFNKRKDSPPSITPNVDLPNPNPLTTDPHTWPAPWRVRLKANIETLQSAFDLSRPEAIQAAIAGTWIQIHRESSQTTSGPVRGSEGLEMRQTGK